MLFFRFPLNWSYVDWTDKFLPVDWGISWIFIKSFKTWMRLLTYLRQKQVIVWFRIALHQKHSLFCFFLETWFRYRIIENFLYFLISWWLSTFSTLVIFRCKMCHLRLLFILMNAYLIQDIFQLIFSFRWFNIIVISTEIFG